MNDIQKVLKSKDESKISFYIENNDMIADLYVKRGLCTKELEKEIQLLKMRYLEITGKKYQK